MASSELRCLVLADTHLRPGRSLPPAVHAAAAEADVILHAGDLVHPCAFEELAPYGPIHAVLGNNDTAFVGKLPDRLEVELSGVRVALIHDSGTRSGRERRLRRWFPEAAVVIFGHSHEPEDREGVDGQRLFNPGSPTDRRRQPQHSFGLLHLGGGKIIDHRIVTIPPPGASIRAATRTR